MLNLLLIEEPGNIELLEKALKESEYRIRKIHDHLSLAAHIKEFNPDIIIFSVVAITEEFLNELNGLATHSSVPVMVFTRECGPGQINKLIQADVSYLSINGSPSTCVKNSIGIALARHKHQQELKNALEEARTQLEDRKQIDRAKAILIKTRNFSEDEAYHTLRKLAMGRNITLGEMARNVIAMADLLK